MEFELDIRKSVDENAASYFEASKKAKKKILGAEEAVRKSKEQLAELQKKQDIHKSEEKKEKREAKWFEKFRWFVSSEGFLCIGGRDATTNEIVVKKHTDKNDIVFHTQMQGSPFFVVKTKAKKPGNATLEETATAVASFSRAWKLGLTNAEVFWVKPEQLTKTAKAGEYVERGAFIVIGKVNGMFADLKLAVGIMGDESVMCGPVPAVKKNCQKYVEIVQANNKTSDTAKRIKHKIGGSTDDIVRSLPAGGCQIK